MKKARPKARATHRQVAMVFRTHGGKRKGAGRKPVGMRRVRLTSRGRSTTRGTRST